MNIIVITGASSGLGREFAKQLDGMMAIDEFWLIARREERLEELSKQLQTKSRILNMDITEDSSLKELNDLLEEEKPVIRMLINCAGFGILGQFMENSLQEQIGMVHLNCTALTKMTYYMLPFMRKKSRIIQLASSAAFLPQPNFAIYAATKSYVLSFSMALGEELRQKGIYVTAVCPGPIRTEFFEIAEKHGASLSVKKFTLVDAPEVVQAALKASAKRSTMSVYSPMMKAFYILSKLFPTKLMLIILRVIK